MSGKKEYDVTVNEEEIRRAEEERQRRAEELAQKRAECERIQNQMQQAYEQAVAQHQRMAQEVAPFLNHLQSLHNKTEVQMQETHRLETMLETQKKQLKQLASLANVTESNLESAQTSFNDERAKAGQLAKSITESTKQEVQQLDKVQLKVEQQMAETFSSMEKQQAEIHNINQHMNRLNEQLQAQEQQANNLDLELSFLDREPALLPATMMTLTAMERNGYSLSEMRAKQGFIAYFEAKDEGHVIGVRHQPVAQSPFETKWAMLAEAFYFAGDEYLDFMNDFIDTAEETGFGHLTYKNHTLSPPKKPNQSMVLPLPKRKPKSEKHNPPVQKEKRIKS